MSRRKRNARKKGRTRTGPNRLERDPGCPDDDVGDSFIDGLDHTAFHIAEQMREKTHTWKETGFAAFTIDELPELTKPLARSRRDWEQLGRYILKWMIWYLRQDIPLLLYGHPTVKLEQLEGATMAFLIVGFETQSEASRN
jgi:hypothetical protein